MAKRDKRKEKRSDDRGGDRRPKVGFWKGLREETRRSIIGLSFIVFSIILFLAGFGSGGMIGNGVYSGAHFLFGLGYWILPILLFLLGVNFFRASDRNLTAPALIAGPFFVLSALGLLSLPAEGMTSVDALGGWIGYWVMTPMTLGLGFAGGSISLLLIFIITILILFDTPLHLGVFSLLFSMFTKKKKADVLTDQEKIAMSLPDPEEAVQTISLKALREEDIAKETPLDEIPEPKPEKTPKEMKVSGLEKSTGKEKEEIKFQFNAHLHEVFTPPPLNLLSGDKGKAGYGDIKANANIIKRTLQNFGVEVEMDEVTVGPSITRYALKPAESVRLSKIVALQRELEYALALAPIRIEAPIPGKSLVGIEVPNTQKSTVGLASLLSDQEWAANPNPLFVPLGKGISGIAQFMNIAKMPHVLVAGTTGSGKSVTIHTIITSLLYRKSPEQLRLIMVDPKRVELTLYNGIPHLLTPVITDARKAILTLKWAAKEMDRRYDVLQEHKVRDISSYHKNVLQPALEKFEKQKADGKTPSDEIPVLPEMMPYIVVVIDELADIMQAYPRELESAIVRLAQMSRAVGIHLILSTQRPSVNVITGLIKANVPARIALQVASQIDSRTILDMAGAENLLGAGDMLFLSADLAKPVRLQSAFISENEVKSVVKFLKENYEGTLGEEISLGSSENKNAYFDTIPEDSLSDAGGEEDDMYEEAKQIVLESGKASTSFLQRRLGLGYARAAKIIDMMEDRGVVGPANGSKPRDVIGRQSSGDEGFGREAE